VQELWHEARGATALQIKHHVMMTIHKHDMAFENIKSP
jgi:hypothetical protein